MDLDQRVPVEQIAGLDCQAMPHLVPGDSDRLEDDVVGGEEDVGEALPLVLLEGRDGAPVVAVLGVEQRHEEARIDEDHRRL